MLAREGGIRHRDGAFQLVVVQASLHYRSTTTFQTKKKTMATGHANTCISPSEKRSTQRPNISEDQEVTTASATFFNHACSGREKQKYEREKQTNPKLVWSNEHKRNLWWSSRDQSFKPKSSFIHKAQRDQRRCCLPITKKFESSRSRALNHPYLFFVILFYFIYPFPFLL